MGHKYTSKELRALGSAAIETKIRGLEKAIETNRSVIRVMHKALELLLADRKPKDAVLFAGFGYEGLVMPIALPDGVTKTKGVST